MENMSSNDTSDSNRTESCVRDLDQMVLLSAVDILTLTLGQPVVIRLLWITFTSKKTLDILNFNLALFHNVQYLICFLHLAILLSRNRFHNLLLRFLFVYVQIGGSMSLSLISLERYVAVIYPTSFSLLRKYRCREVCAVQVWLLSLGLAFMTVLVPKEAFIHHKLLSSAPMYVMLAMNGAMAWFSVRIANALKKSGPGSDKLHPMKRRALTTVRATFIITFFCYLPVSLMEKWKFSSEDLYDCVSKPAGIFLLSVASVVHPLFYLSTQGKLCPCA